MIHLLRIFAVCVASLLFIFQGKGASLVTATITVTNTAGVGTNWIVNGNTRTWTNAAGTPASSWITTGANSNSVATNLYNHIVRYPYTSPFLTIQRIQSNVFTLRGTSVSVTTNNYFSVTYSTNISTNLTFVQVPFENVTGDTNRTNNAHWLIDALNTYPRTNAFKTNATAMSNYLTRGASPQQYVAGPVQFNGELLGAKGGGLTNFHIRNASNITGRVTALTNGYWTNGVLDAPFMTNARAVGTLYVTDALVVTNSITSYGDIGIYPPGSILTWDNGSGGQALISQTLRSLLQFSDSAGNINLEVSTNRIWTPGTFYGNGLVISNGFLTTNTVFKGTNIAGGSWSYPRSDISTIANGNNISVPIGTNRFIRLSGTVTATPTICGMIGGATSGGLDGQDVIIHNDLGYSCTFAQNTVDPVAANRLETPSGTDLTIANNGWIQFIYSGADARWHAVKTFPAVESVTLSGTATNMQIYQTDGNSALTINSLIGLGGANFWQTLYTNGQVVSGVNSNGTAFFLPATGRTNNALEIQTTNGVPLTYGNSNGMMIHKPRTGYTFDAVQVQSTNEQVVFGVRSNAVTYAKALTGSTDNAFEIQTTNGTALTFVRSNHTLVASNISQTPLAVTSGSSEIGVPFRLFTITNNILITNVTTLVSCNSNEWGTFTLPANFLRPGMTIHCVWQGNLFSGTTTITNAVKVGSSIVATNHVNFAAAFTGDTWRSEYDITCRSTGASGSVVCEGFIMIPTSAGGGASVRRLRLASGAVTIDTTAAQTLGFDWHPGGATASINLGIGYGVVYP